MWYSLFLCQTMVRVLPARCVSRVPLAGVEKDDLSLPVRRSQVFTSPLRSLVIMVLSSGNSLTDAMLSEPRSAAISSVVIESLRKPSIGQNLMVLSLDVEMREEEKVMKVTNSECPTKCLMRRAPELVMSQTYMVLNAEEA